STRHSSAGSVVWRLRPPPQSPRRPSAGSPGTRPSARERHAGTRPTRRSGIGDAIANSPTYVFNPFIDIPQRPFDFGNTQKARVAGTVFDDLNLDGVIDPSEQPAAGQTVYVDLNRNGINEIGRAHV